MLLFNSNWMYYMLYFFDTLALSVTDSVTERAKVSKCPNTSTCSME
jgi:hypothetical protein